MILASASASAKTILFGEHAVVYDMPAIAIPLSTLRAYARIEQDLDAAGLIIEAPDIFFSMPFSEMEEIHPIGAAISLFYKTFGRNLPANHRLSIHSDIPIASGLGSGAAVSISIFRAFSMLESIELSASQLSRLAFEIEKIHHGTPSGIDNTVIAYEKPIWFIRERECTQLQCRYPFHFLIANSGIPSSTAIPVRDVRALWMQNPKSIQALFEAIGAITHQGIGALDQGNASELGKLMTLNHEILRELTVSSERLDEMVCRAIAAGAYGAKMTGGGRGGNVLILAEPDQMPTIISNLKEMGVNQYFQTALVPQTSNESGT
ncbi:MAG: mevalonate kinase [Anaerolineae bacterium]|nr:mevalonate kinase [Anaerolineae bacterium]